MIDPEIERIKEQIGTWSRKEWHDFGNALNATVVTVAVVQRVQDSQSKQLDRIEAAVSEKFEDIVARVMVLETQTNHASAVGRNWGMGAGAIGSAIAGALAYFLGSK